MGPAALEGAREERSTDGREPRRPDVQPSRRMRRAERRGARASRGGAVGEGPPQTQEPREGVPGRPPEEPSAVPRPPGPRGQTLASAFVSQLSPEPGKPGVGRPPPAGSMRPEEALASGRSELRAAALARVHAAERPVLTAGPLRGKAGGPPAPSPSSPAAWALSSDRLCPGSHAHWLWTSLFLADHLPAFPGLSGIPSNSKHFLSSAGLRSESLTVARSCQQSWPGEGLRPCPWSLVCLPPPRQPLRGFPEAQGLPARPLPLGCPGWQAWPPRTHLTRTVGSWRLGCGGHCTSLSPGPPRGLKSCSHIRSLRRGGGDPR